MSWNKIDLIGKKFNKLTVISFAYSDRKRRYWNCSCECGNPSHLVNTTQLIGNKIKTCGCEGIAKPYHWLSHIPEYNVWKNLIKRCSNTRVHNFKNYGGRGISVCNRWLEPKGKGFLNFLADIGRRPAAGYSIERDDVNGNYTPENCKWIPSAEQYNNTTRSRFIKLNGEIKTLSQWSRILKMTPSNLSRSLKVKTIEQILNDKAHRN